MRIIDCIKIYHLWLIAEGDKYLTKDEIQDEILVTMELIEKLGGNDDESII